MKVTGSLILGRASPVPTLVGERCTVACKINLWRDWHD